MMTRKEFIRSGLAAAAGLLTSRLASGSDMSGAALYGEKYSKKEKMQLKLLTEQRHEARWRTRRIILNNDGNDVISSPEEIITPEMFLSKRILGIPGTQVDTYCYCTGITFGGHHKGQSDRLIQNRLGMDHTVLELDKAGLDPFKLIVKYCRQHNIEVFWSHRMNDNHDYQPSSSELISEFKASHPEYLLGYDLELAPKQATCFNYALPQVRDKMVRCCAEVLDEYDIDGIELDFFRHLTFFKSTVTRGSATEEEQEMMTDMVRRIRAVLDKAGMRRGHPVLLSVRVPDSLGFSKGIGLDYDKWVKEDLVDLIIANDYLKFEPWAVIANYGKANNIPVYASLEMRRLNLLEPGLDPYLDNLVLNDAGVRIWMDEAYAAWLSGVNGIHTYNRFNTTDPLFRLIGDPYVLAQNGAQPRESFGNDAKGYCDPKYWLASGRKFLNIPETIEYHKPPIKVSWPGADYDYTRIQ